jgi:nitroreductase
MSNRNATADHPIHELLLKRHSPYAFDPERSVSESDVAALFEAARWTMSSYNAQPWRYVVASRDRDPETWRKIHEVLVEGNRPWAVNAAVLALGVLRRSFEHNGKPNKAAAHDLGAASAMLTVEATARGLVVHQMIGVEPEKAHEAFGLGEDEEVFTALAIGHEGGLDRLDETYAKRDRAPRTRKPLSEIIVGGSF